MVSREFDNRKGESVIDCTFVMRCSVEENVDPLTVVGQDRLQKIGLPVRRVPPQQRNGLASPRVHFAAVFRPGASAKCTLVETVRGVTR
jgi:hypothetical protein